MRKTNAWENRYWKREIMEFIGTIKDDDEIEYESEDTDSDEDVIIIWSYYLIIFCY